MIALTHELIPNSDRSAVTDRELFHGLLNPERWVQFLPKARERIHTELSRLPETLSNDLEFLSDLPFLDRENFPFVDIPDDLDVTNCRNLIRQFAPTALQGQCWLQRFSQAANGHTGVAAALFRVYQANLDQYSRQRDVNAYQFLMQCSDIDLPPIYGHAFSRHEQLTDAAFGLALVRICLARCAPDFPGELIGFTAANVFGLSVIAQNEFISWFSDLGIPDVYQSAMARGRSKATVACQEAAIAFLRDRRSSEIDQSNRTIAAGIQLYVAVDRVFWSTIFESHAQFQSPADRVLKLFRKKARYAQGYHQETFVGGVGLDQWFTEGLTDGSAFLEALVRSEWFDPVNPDQSLFFTRVVAPSGSMFGIFTPTELQIIREWLEARKLSASDTVDLTDSREILYPSRAGLEVVPVTTATTAVRSRPAVRDLFHRLVNVYHYPEVLPAAQYYVEKCLKVTKWALRLSRKPELSCFQYSHAAFECRINRIYQHQVTAYRPLQGKPRLNRGAWIWLIKQFAPTILVDGCWLQNMNSPGMDHCPVSKSLWRIFADEIGAGECSLNHPAIYRKLLDNLDIDLPGIDELQFAKHKDFISSAFDVPVYLLAISQFPNSFIPELIGINLAIELSGLGGGYRRLAESLDYWGIDSTIVRVHLSIDNMASGHSAIAKTAVTQYLDHILSESGERTMQCHWRRIWMGFVSIRIVPLKFVGHLGWSHLIRSANKRFRGTCSPDFRPE